MGSSNTGGVRRGDVVIVALCDGDYSYAGVCTSRKGNRAYVLTASSGHSFRTDRASPRLTVSESRPWMRRARFGVLFDESKKYSGNNLGVQAGAPDQKEN